MAQREKLHGRGCQGIEGEGMLGDREGGGSGPKERPRGGGGCRQVQPQDYDVAMDTCKGKNKEGAESDP